MNTVLSPRLCAALLLLSSASGFAQPSGPKPKSEPTAPKPSSTESPASLPVASFDVTKLSDPVAKVNGKPISREELVTMVTGLLRSQGAAIDDVPADKRKFVFADVLQQKINDALITEKSDSVKVEDAEINAELDKIKASVGDEKELEKKLTAIGKNIDTLKAEITKGIKQRKHLESLLKDKIKVSDAEVEAYYKSNLDKFKAPDMLLTKQIVFAASQDAPMDVIAEKKKKADAITEVLKKDPSKFDELVKTESEDPQSKANAGEMIIPKDKFPFPEFYDAIDKLKVDEITAQPLRTPVAFHIVKLIQKKAAQTLELKDVKDKVKAYLENQKRQVEFKKYLDEIRKGAKIEILEVQLKLEPQVK